MRARPRDTGLDRVALLIALRHRLLWAHARSRNGRIVLFVVGYLSLALVAGLMAVAGLAAAGASARTGQATFVASVALSTVFVNSTLGALVLGIGVDETFSDAALRRYPMTSASRFAVRHLIGLLDPMWVIAFALVLGLAAGFSAAGHGSFWSALLAALLFVSATYLVARTSAQLRVWLSSTRAGAPLLVAGGIAVLMLLPLAPAFLSAAREEGAPAAIVALEITPPFAAGSAMTDATPAAVVGLARLAAWCLCLGVLLAATERLPAGRQRFGRKASRWDGAYDRAGAFAGRRLSPLAGKVLRYHVRSAIRWNYPFVLPMLFVMSRNFAGETFLFALSVAPAAGFLSTVPLSLNLFGCDGPGVRRYLLLPVSAAQTLRTVALAGLLPGVALVLAGVLMWLGFSARPMDVRMPIVLLSAGFGGLLFFHALGLWTSLVSPRPIPFGLALGNNLSASANLVMGVAMAALFFLPIRLTKLDQDQVLQLWWTAPLALTGAGALYGIVLSVGGSVFAARRERILDALEQRR